MEGFTQLKFCLPDNSWLCQVDKEQAQPYTTLYFKIKKKENSVVYKENMKKYMPEK